jgi:hypothetical protein
MYLSKIQDDKMMKGLPEQILSVVKSAKPRLQVIPAESAQFKPEREDWSKQEILGHLIDSALNNHQRFVRGAYNAAENFPPYDQVRWVEIQAYNERNWNEVVNLWFTVNLHLCLVMDRLSEEDLQNLCNIGRDTPVTLDFVAKDYLRHMNMHLSQILELVD